MSNPTITKTQQSTKKKTWNRIKKARNRVKHKPNSWSENEKFRSIQKYLPLKAYVTELLLDRLRSYRLKKYAISRSIYHSILSGIPFVRNIKTVFWIDNSETKI